MNIWFQFDQSQSLGRKGPHSNIMGWNYDKHNLTNSQGEEKVRQWKTVLTKIRPCICTALPGDQFARRWQNDRLTRITPTHTVIKFQLISNPQMESHTLLEIRPCSPRTQAFPWGLQCSFLKILFPGSFLSVINIHYSCASLKVYILLWFSSSASQKHVTTIIQVCHPRKIANNTGINQFPGQRHKESPLEFHFFTLFSRMLHAMF